MKKNLIIGILALVYSGSLVEADIEFLKTEQTPSNELLNTVAAKNLKITRDVKIANKGCLDPASFPIKALAHLENVSEIKAAIETADKKKHKLLVTLENNGGLKKKNPTFTATVDIKEFNFKASNIWVFYFSGEETYANAINVMCNVVYESFNE